MFCRTCGAEIRDGSKFCSECGAAQQDVTSSPNANTRNHIPPINQLNQVTVEKAPYNMMCIIGLILSLFSLLFNLFALLGMAGIIVSVIGLMTCQQKNERYCNQSFFHDLCRDCTFSLHITLKQKIPCFVATPEI